MNSLRAETKQNKTKNIKERKIKNHREFDKKRNKVEKNWKNGFTSKFFLIACSEGGFWKKKDFRKDFR